MAAIGGAMLALGILAAISDGGVASLGEAFAVWLIVTLSIAVLGLVVLVPYLVLVEILLRGGQRGRRFAVVLAAVMAGGGLILSRIGEIQPTPESLLPALGATALGALYGTLVRLPRPRG